MLTDLYAGSRLDAEKRSEVISIRELEQRISSIAPALDAMAFLEPTTQVKILAEIKRASPSKGQLAQIPDPSELARIYALNGASAISVLTEERKFKGSLKDLIDVREAVDVPLLRKDFIENEYQILEARAAGADLILLIVAGLPEAEIARLMKFSTELGMTPFIETHTAEELKIALGLGSGLIGINARDLTTFETDRNLFAELVDQIPAKVIKVAESAVRNRDDVAHYRDSGADVVLVGEALVTNDPATMLRSFLTVDKT